MGAAAVFAVFLLLCLICVGIYFATRPSTQQDPLPPGVPTGDFQNSCSSWIVKDNTITARCGNSSGGTTTSILDTSTCDFSGGKGIANQNGKLTCEWNKADRPALPSTIPFGDFTNSCSKWSINGNVITGNCDAGGTVNTSTIDYTTCDFSTGKGIANRGGKLVCELNKADRPVLPSGVQGSFTNSCNSYSINGTVITGKCDNGHNNSLTSTLDYSRCDLTKDISNQGGILSCTSKTSQTIPIGFGLTTTIPPGTITGTLSTMQPLMLSGLSGLFQQK